MMITATLHLYEKAGVPRSITFDPLSVESFRFGGATAPTVIDIRTRSGDSIQINDPEGAVSAAIVEAKEEELRWFAAPPFEESPE